MKKVLPIIFITLLIVAFGVFWKFSKNDVQKLTVTTFEECVEAGNSVMESYPRQCRVNGETFTEFIGNELEKNDLIRINTPRPNQTISSPLVIKGEARGGWYSEASFPVVLTDWDGKIIAQGIATAKSEWMTTEFVPYEATLNFSIDKNVYSNRGTLVLRKDNPSGLPQNDDALEIPIVFAKPTNVGTEPPVACTMEAKICSDGSAVGRTGPNCEFAQCPSASSGIEGTVMAGPTCPVMQNPPDPNCNDKPVKTNVSVYRASDTSRSIAMLESDANGRFTVSLPPGDYVVMAGPYGMPFPRCSNSTATVEVSGYTQIIVSCDTGIR